MKNNILIAALVALTCAHSSVQSASFNRTLAAGSAVLGVGAGTLAYNRWMAECPKSFVERHPNVARSQNILISSSMGFRDGQLETVEAIQKKYALRNSALVVIGVGILAYGAASALYNKFLKLNQEADKKMEKYNRLDAIGL